MNISPLSRHHGIEHPSCGKTSGIGHADWTKIPTRSDDLLPKKEIEQLVKEKAVEFENAASKQEQNRIWEEVQGLFTQYVSHGSPDRKTLLKNALKTIEEQTGSTLKKLFPNIDTTETLFDYLNEADINRKGMKIDKAYSFASGTVTAALSTTGTPHFSIAQNGQEIMSISTRGNVGYASTPTETALQKEIAGVWHSARGSAKNMPASSQMTESGGIDITV